MLRAMKLPYYLLAVVIVLALSGCSSSTTAQIASPHADSYHASSSQATPAHRVPMPTVSASSIPSSSPPPVRLLIPSIGVNSSIESAGVLPNGDMETPSVNPWDDVGWLKSGPVPGQRGSAVIDGHLDRPGGSPAVFWRLRELQAGDAVMIVNAQGKTVHFRVIQVMFYTPQQAPLQQIFGNGGGTFLNLITCAGDWIPSQHQTTLRLVVYTTLA